MRGTRDSEDRFIRGILLGAAVVAVSAGLAASVAAAVMLSLNFNALSWLE